VIQSACAVLGAHVVVMDAATPVATLLPVLASEGVRALFITPRDGTQSRAAALSTALEPEFEPFARAAVWGYAPLASKRLRSLKFVVHTGMEPVDGMVRLSDLPVHGAGESVTHVHARVGVTSLLTVRAEGEYVEDDIAAAQHGVAAGDALFSHYNATGGKVTTASHAKVLSMAAAAAKAAGLTSNDTLALTASPHTAFGFAAGWAAALGAHAKLGASLPVSVGSTGTGRHQGCRLLATTLAPTRCPLSDRHIRCPAPLLAPAQCCPPPRVSTPALRWRP